VNAAVIYLLLLKATVTSFSGMGSLPQIRHDFVETRQAISGEQLSEAVLVGRATPGPMGAYVVGVGYLAGGWAGAVAGWLALITPAFAAVPLLVTVRRWLHLPRMRSMVSAVVIASATLLAPAALSLAMDGFSELIALAFG
jgi:chromate transporter